ncbi:hypothetical protein RFI_10239, partial [Reticulomyxa filosa]
MDKLNATSHSKQMEQWSAKAIASRQRLQAKQGDSMKRSFIHFNNKNKNNDNDNDDNDNIRNPNLVFDNTTGNYYMIYSTDYGVAKNQSNILIS